MVYPIKEIFLFGFNSGIFFSILFSCCRKIITEKKKKLCAYLHIWVIYIWFISVFYNRKQYFYSLLLKYALLKKIPLQLTVWNSTYQKFLISTLLHLESIMGGKESAQVLLCMVRSRYVISWKKMENENKPFKLFQWEIFLHVSINSNLCLYFLLKSLFPVKHHRAERQINAVSNSSREGKLWKTGTKVLLDFIQQLLQTDFLKWDVGSMFAEMKI